MRGILIFFMVLWIPSISGYEIGYGNQQFAYRQYYLGNLAFEEEAYPRAVQYFRSAYQILPDNFTFAMAYAIGLALTEKPHQALKVIEKAFNYSDEEEIAKSRAYLFFAEGLSKIHTGDYRGAVKSLKKTLWWSHAGQSEEIHSVVYNLLGYISVVNQGKGAHRRAGLKRHWHVHQRDLVTAQKYFQKALALDSANHSALRNYNYLAELLDSDVLRQAEGKSVQESASAYTGGGIMSGINWLESYDEIVMLLDITGSMVMEKVPCKGTTRFEVMKEMAAAVYSKIPSHIPVGLGTIDGDCGKNPKNWVKVGSLSERDFTNTLRFLIPDGTTPMIERLLRAPELFSVNAQKKAIFLVSDGADTCPNRKIDICKWAEEKAAEGITIHTLSYLDPNAINASAFSDYTCLADKTGGKVLYLDNYGCSNLRFSFDLVASISKSVPKLEKADCWGPSFNNLWAIFPIEK